MKVFKEEQRFTQLWLMILLSISGLIVLSVIFFTYIKNPNAYSVLELIAIIASVVLALGLIFVFKLTTKIDEQGIHYKFFPFHLKFKLIKWNELNKAYVRTYDAITEYGGWGLKGGALWNKSKGIAINVKGDIGIQLELMNGKKILIGTQLKPQANSTLDNYKHRIKNG